MVVERNDQTRGELRLAFGVSVREKPAGRRGPGTSVSGCPPHIRAGHFSPSNLGSADRPLVVSHDHVVVDEPCCPEDPNRAQAGIHSRPEGIRASDSAQRKTEADAATAHPRSRLTSVRLRPEGHTRRPVPIRYRHQTRDHGAVIPVSSDQITEALTRGSGRDASNYVEEVQHAVTPISGSRGRTSSAEAAKRTTTRLPDQPGDALMVRGRAVNAISHQPRSIRGTGTQFVAGHLPAIPHHLSAQRCRSADIPGGTKGRRPGRRCAQPGIIRGAA